MAITGRVYVKMQLHDHGTTAPTRSLTTVHSS